VKESQRSRVNNLISNDKIVKKKYIQEKKHWGKKHKSTRVNSTKPSLRIWDWENKKKSGTNNEVQDLAIKRSNDKFFKKPILNRRIKKWS